MNPIIAGQQDSEPYKGLAVDLSAVELAAIDLDLDEEALEALVIVEEVPAFKDEIADQLVESWCRTRDTVAEIAERRLCAGVALAPVLLFSAPAPPRLSAAGYRAA